MSEDMTQMTRKELFRSQALKPQPIKLIVVAVELPSGAIETIVNTQDLPGKYEYYIKAYDEDMRLIANPSIGIAGWLFV